MQKADRIPELELMKAIAIVGMVFVHIYEYTGFAFSTNEGAVYLLRLTVEFFGGVISAGTFMFAMGWGSAFSQKATPRTCFDRFTQLMLLGVVMNLFTQWIPMLTAAEKTSLAEGWYRIFAEDIYPFAALAMLYFAIIKKLFQREKHRIIESAALLFIALAINMLIPPDGVSTGSNLVLNIQLLNAGADVTASALFKDTSDLPEGTINYGNIFDIYKYDNTLCTVDVTGRELKAYMESSAECYNQWKPGDINISFDPEFPGYLYDTFGGVEYEINLSKPMGERIENVMFCGKPLEDDQVLKLAINNYRYSSRLKSRNMIEGTRDWESSNSVRTMIVEYFGENSPMTPTFDNNWHITGVDLSEDDSHRAEIIDYINQGLLPTPYNESYNLADYDALVAQAEANRKAGVTLDEHEDH